MTPRVVRLPPVAITELETELTLAPLPLAVRTALEQALTAYAHDVPVTPATRRRWRADQRALVATGRRLLDLIAHRSVEDTLDAADCGAPRSALQELLAARVAQWEARATPSPSARRPTDWRRRRLLWRALSAFVAAGVPETSDACARGLRAVLRIADRVDGVPPTSGSLRLVRAVCRDYRDRHTWGPRSVLRRLYEPRA